MRHPFLASPRSPATPPSLIPGPPSTDNTDAYPVHLDAVWSHVSTYKKLMMHLKEHCAYVTLRAVAGGLVFTGSSAVDHVCFEATLRPSAFVSFRSHWPTEAAVELNMYTLYTIMKKATAFRCERVRLQVEWHSRGYYAVTVGFETQNKYERFHMRGAPTDVVPSVCHAVANTTLRTVDLNTALLTESFQRFDEESFRTLTLTVHRTGHRRRSLCLDAVEDTLSMRGRTDSARGKVYVPYATRDSKGTNEPRDTRRTSSRKTRVGNYLLTTLRSVTRFATLSPTKVLVLGYCAQDAPVCVTFDVGPHGAVQCLLPAISDDTLGWCASSDSSEEEDTLERLARRRVAKHASRRAAATTEEAATTEGVRSHLSPRRRRK